MYFAGSRPSRAAAFGRHTLSRKLFGHEVAFVDCQACCMHIPDGHVHQRLLWQTYLLCTCLAHHELTVLMLLLQCFSWSASSFSPARAGPYKILAPSGHTSWFQCSTNRRSSMSACTAVCIPWRFLLRTVVLHATLSLHVVSPLELCINSEFSFAAGQYSCLCSKGRLTMLQ